MGVSNNFSSVVCLGAFNPAILNADFLGKNCGYRFIGVPKEQITPVAAEVTDDKISIYVDFSKFQVFMKSADDTQALSCIKLAHKYLTILPFTPVNAFGINFNYSVPNVATAVADMKFYEHVSAVGLALNETVEILSATKAERNKRPDLRMVELHLKSARNLKISIHMESAADQFTVNFNFEADSLSKDKSRLNEILSSYAEICAERDGLMDSLLGYFK